ncbi:hypothetical protein [Roseateles sp.]|uniref:hypothetical protein n=1 Tax=Roseateles sp. TaxID=1971397 RepID=UPI003D1072EA
MFFPFMVIPPVLLISFWWSVYFSIDAHRQAALFAVVASLPGIFLLHRRVTKHVSQGIHPYFHSSRRISLGTYFSGWLGIFLLLYGWVLVIFALALLLSRSQSTEYSYLVLEAESCTKKCLGCPSRVKLSGWPGLSESSLCVSGMEPSVHVGQLLLVRGYFSSHAIYVKGLLYVKAG